MLTEQLVIRADPSIRERLDAYATAMRELFGVRLSLAGAARAALERGLDVLEADVDAARKARG